MTDPHPERHAHARWRNRGSAIAFVAVTDSDRRVLKVIGELDLADCDEVAQLCTGERTADVEVDLSDLTFLDCGGYRAFAVSHAELAAHDRTLTLIGATGEPRRLLDLIRRLDPTGPS